jgi:hypothetical protein
VPTIARQRTRTDSWLRSQRSSPQSVALPPFRGRVERFSAQFNGTAVVRQSWDHPVPACSSLLLTVTSGGSTTPTSAAAKRRSTSVMTVPWAVTNGMLSEPD